MGEEFGKADFSLAGHENDEVPAAGGGGLGFDFGGVFVVVHCRGCGCDCFVSDAGAARERGWTDLGPSVLCWLCDGRCRPVRYNTVCALFL